MELKCEYGQGYLFSKPVEAGAAEALIARKPEWHASAFPAVNEYSVTASNNLIPIRCA
jgi:hypothetical protein